MRGILGFRHKTYRILLRLCELEENGSITDSQRSYLQALRHMYNKRLMRGIKRGLRELNKIPEDPNKRLILKVPIGYCPGSHGFYQTFKLPYL